MKKIMMLMMVVVLMVTACTSNTNNETLSKLDKIKEKGELVLGTSADYPPYEYHIMVDGQDKITGFDIVIAEKIADSLGVKLRIVDMKFDGLLAALMTEKVDIVIAGMTPTEDRKKNVDFSMTYYDANQTMIVLKENVDTLSSIEAFSDQRVGYQKGSIQEQVATDQFVNSELQGLSKITDLVIALKAKKVEGIVLAEPVAESYAKNNDDIAINGIDLGKEDGVSVAIAKGNEKLVEHIDSVLSEMIEDGTLSQVIADEIMKADN